MSGQGRRLSRAQRQAERRREARERREQASRRPAAGEDLFRRWTPGDARRPPPRDETADRVAEAARLAGLVETMVRLTDGTRRDDARLRTHADMLVARAAPSDPDLVLDAVAVRLTDALAAVCRGGWPADDLPRLVERTLGPDHVGTLRAVLDGRPLRDLASGLGLAALLARTPLLEASALLDAEGAEKAASGATEHPKLARVRALLAKAESTPYPEEAELLSAKAQELVARHALDGLLAAARDTHAGPRPRVRRLWLDAPYIDAKAALVAAVARANRCRVAAAVPLGFCVVVGDARDLATTELLVTSLLVQAAAAMLQHERSAPPGSGRTRSFRRAFLLAYAQRVGERLAEASAEAYREADGDALPVLAAQEERVAAAFEAAVPHTVARASTVSNDVGFRAGRAAADRARLDVAERLEEG